MSFLVSLDPGSSKCGLVLADVKSRLVLEGKIVDSDAVIHMINKWQEKFTCRKLILGNGTSSKYWIKPLSELCVVEVVDEKGSTLRARDRYWELWPPLGWRQYIPRGLILPPNNLDAVAALVLLEDYLGAKLKWSGPPVFKNEL